MNEIILQTGREYFKKSTTTYLKVNAIFKKLGFKEVHTRGELREGRICEQLTLFIHPQINSRFHRDATIPSGIQNLWINMNGYRGHNTIRRIGGWDESVERIMIDELHIGDYYKERNFVILFFPIYDTKLEYGLKNKFLFHILEEFSKEIMRIKPELVEVSKKLREELLSKFLNEIKTSIITFKDRIRDKQAIVEDRRRQELEHLSDINQLQQEIRVLKGTYKTLITDIEKKMRDIKKLPFVTRVGISNQGIRVDFKHIDLEWNGRKVELGECYCYLNPRNLQIKNKSPVIYNGTTYHSPHISGSSVCFGGGKEKAYNLLANMKLKELVYFIYIYLKTYYEGDTYLSLASWERCKKNGGEYYDGDDDDGEEEDD